MNDTARPSPAPSLRRHWRWMRFALGLLGLSALVILLTVQLIQGERERRARFMVATASALARLSAARIEQQINEAAAAPVSFGHAEVVHDTGGGWRLRLSERTDRLPGPAPRALDIPVQALREPLAQASLGEEGAASLRTAGLQLVQRYRNGPDTQPTPFGSTVVSAELRETLAPTPMSGAYRAVTTLDSVARLNAFQRITNAPLYVIVGVPEHLGPAGLSRFDLPLLMLAALTLLLAVIATLWIYHLSLQRMGDTQRRYQSLVENSEDAIVTKSMDGLITGWNRAAERIFGWSAREMLGQPITRLVPADLQREEAEIMSQLRQGQRIEALETERLTQSGRRVPMSITISPLRDPSGRIVGASKIARDISRQKQLEAEVRAQALHDPLTGLPNRRLFADRLAHAQQQSHRSAQWAALLFLDLDGFKQLNDSAGHDAGDECLAQVAERLRRTLRESDTAARLGGDEFALLCPDLGADEAQAHEAAARFAARVSQAIADPMVLSHGTAHIGVSIGRVLFRGTAQEPDALLRSADQSMYTNKQARRRARA